MAIVAFGVHKISLKTPILGGCPTLLTVCLVSLSPGLLCFILFRGKTYFFFWVQKVQSPGYVRWGGLWQADPFLRWLWDLSCFPPSPRLTGTSHYCVSVFTRSRWGTSLHVGISLCKLLVPVFSAALNSGIYSEFRLTSAVLLSLLQVLF